MLEEASKLSSQKSPEVAVNHYNIVSQHRIMCAVLLEHKSSSAAVNKQWDNYANYRLQIMKVYCQAYAEHVQCAKGFL